jgi:TonB family protein
MSERKPCIRCGRAIDGWAKLCPFCNWDQASLTPPPAPRPQQAAPPNPDEDVKELIKKKGAYILGGLMILVLSFLIGMVINSDDTPENVPEPVTAEKEVVPPVKRADTPLVPTNERGGIEQPITSAPVASSPDGMSNGYDRSDATAVSSSEYNQLAQRARAERERMASLVDPRSISGAAYAQGQRSVRRPVQQTAQAVPPLPGSQEPGAAPRAGRGTRTRPIAEYQPIPRISANGTARLSMIIGADGRVRSINIEQALDRNTGELVAAVQRWRFRPATENGEPVAAPYSVDIKFGGQ